jgi:large subunit ribosomal protein L9
MKVRLWQDIDKLGKRGEIVEVKAGYARNYLLPRKLAAAATAGMDREFELEKRRQAKVDAKLVSDAKGVAEKLASLTSGVSLEVNTNDEGHLYGSITPTMIAEALRDKGLKVEPKTIEIKDPIKQTGTYEVLVNLHREVKPVLKVWVLSTKPPEKKDEGKKEEPTKS